jgi:hypothetical protein
VFYRHFVVESSPSHRAADQGRGLSPRDALRRELAALPLDQQLARVSPSGAVQRHASPSRAPVQQRQDGSAAAEAEALPALVGVVNTVLQQVATSFMRHAHPPGSPPLAALGAAHYAPDTVVELAAGVRGYLDAVVSSAAAHRHVDPMGGQTSEPFALDPGALELPLQLDTVTGAETTVVDLAAHLHADLARFARFLALHEHAGPRGSTGPTAIPSLIALAPLAALGGVAPSGPTAPPAQRPSLPFLNVSTLDKGLDEEARKRQKWSFERSERDVAEGKDFASATTKIGLMNAIRARGER